MFTFLVFLSAFLLEGIGTYVSVVGLGHLFAYSWVVMIMAVALDIAKVINVTFLYRHWKEIGMTLKSYMLAATFVLMVITSTGVFGYLSGEFQKAISGNTQQTVLIQSLVDEQGRLQKRKEEIDKQIAQLPQNNVRGRRQLMTQFGPEVDRLNARLAEIDTKLPELKVQNIEKETHVGPIMYVAQAFDTTPEKAVKWIIFTIIGVFDPLAIAMLVGGNFLLARKKEEIAEPPRENLEELLAKITDEHLGEFPPVTPTFNELPQWETHTTFVAEPAVIEVPKKPKRKYVRKQKTDPDVVQPGFKMTENERGALVDAMKLTPEVREQFGLPPEREKVVIKKTEKKAPPPKVVVANDGDKEVIKIEKPLMKSSLESVKAGDGDYKTPGSPSALARQYKED